MSKNSYENFYKFYKANNNRKGLEIFKGWSFCGVQNQYTWAIFLGKVGLRIKNNDVIADPVSNPGAPSYLFNWGIEVMMRKYHAALDDIL